MSEKIDVVRHIRLHLVTDGDKNGQTMGWVHTHGMDDLGFPELEIREVPLFMGRAAAHILNEAASYMVNSGRVVKLGQRLDLEGMAIVEFAKLDPVVGGENHYDVERWALVTPAFMKGHCGHPDHVEIGDVTLQ